MCDIGGRCVVCHLEGRCRRPRSTMTTHCVPVFADKKVSGHWWNAASVLKHMSNVKPIFNC